MFGTFDQLFAPGRRHTEEERRRQELVLEEAGDADPGRGPIDLSSGVVLVRQVRASEPSGASEPRSAPEPSSAPEPRSAPEPQAAGNG
ncbi:hypothetical protein CP967_07275 [Streptomyces nitrosporeus]|uniref:Uncharacterized protein n=1 Tax=Streptomyces nitrosporeus TaxID=28894 RepID=A0A5J6F619_9ACTN|nr:DUF6191 domain-containing protein [Streptomyces nitrosporeus]QEU71788.1 hypothetical protein CP967_07275 [Streptomyces nitrosporeus]GGY94251.1 hypothetical protein GCM10010327_26110 [Streptomyces nitrosporeus]